MGLEKSKGLQLGESYEGWGAGLMEQGAEGMLEQGAEVLMYGDGDPKKGELVDKP